MLSLFPDLLDWSYYVPFFFRLFIGSYLVAVGVKIIQRGNTEGTTTWIGLGGMLNMLGIAFIVGIAIQVDGVIGFVIALLASYTKHTNVVLASQTTQFYILFALVCLALVFLGPGPYSYDLPL